MKGHVRRRGKSWAVVLYLGRDERGKHSYQWHSAPTKREAEMLLGKLLADAQAGSLVRTSSQTVREYMASWLESYARRNVAPKTYVSYEGNVRRHIIPHIGAVRLQQLKPGQIQAMYTKLLKKGLSNRTVHYVHSTLHVALNHAVRLELIPRNPAASVLAPKEVRRRPKVLDPLEIQRLLTGIRGHRVHLPVLLAIFTGMRRGEILGLTWAQVDLETDLIHVSQTLHSAKGGAPCFGDPKTDLSRRTIALPKTAVAALLDQQEMQREHKRQLGPAYRDYGLVVALEDGRAWEGANFAHSYLRQIRRLGFSGIRFHDLRHCHATTLLLAGVHPKIVSERLGHSQISTTMNVYSHVLPQMQRDAALAVEKALSVTRDASPTVH